MTDLSDTQALAIAAAAPGVEPHDSPTLTLSQQKALWDQFFAAKSALEAADWPIVRLIREQDGSHSLQCPWCDAPLGKIADDFDSPRVHAVGVGFETSGVVRIEVNRAPSLVTAAEFGIFMNADSTPETDVVGYSCDDCDGTLQIPGERTW